MRLEALSKDYEIGATPLRHALARLENEGFVELIPNRGYFATSLSGSDFRDLVFSRQVIEDALLKKSIVAGDDAWEADVIAAFHLLQKCTIDFDAGDLNTIKQWNSRHLRFHTALLSGFHAPRLLSNYIGLFDHLQRHQMAVMVLPGTAGLAFTESELTEMRQQLLLATSNEKHAEIMDAALSKNVPLTLELMQEHVSLTQMEMKTSGDKDV